MTKSNCLLIKQFRAEHKKEIIYIYIFTIEMTNCNDFPRLGKRKFKMSLYIWECPKERYPKLTFIYLKPY